MTAEKRRPKTVTLSTAKLCMLGDYTNAEHEHGVLDIISSELSIMPLAQGIRIKIESSTLGHGLASDTLQPCTSSWNHADPQHLTSKLSS
jgi:hypothetical protein